MAQIPPSVIVNYPPVYLKPTRTAGFTLIELLVVIGIIGVLAVILFSVASTVQNRAKKVQAISDMRSVRVAMISYYTDYRKYPLNDEQLNAVRYQLGDTVYGDPGGLYSSADLFDILRAVADDNHNQNNELNPTLTVYWDGPFAKSTTNPRNGITLQDYQDGSDTVKKGSLVDPWGNPYLVWIDADGDGDLTTLIGQYYNDVKANVNPVTPGGPPMGIEFSSLGPDGEFGTKENKILAGSDDVVTW